MKNTLRPTVSRLRAVPALALCLSLSLLTPWLCIEKGDAASLAPPDTQAAERVRSEASRYDQAMREISALATTPIKTEQDARSVVERIKKLDASLRVGTYSKMVQLAIDNAAFKRSVEAQAEKVGPATFQSQIRRNPRSITDVGGAAEVKQTIQRQLRSDAETLKKVGKRLQDIAASHRVNRTTTPSRQGSVVPIGLAATDGIFIRAGYHALEEGAPAEPSAYPQGWEVAVGGALVAAAVILIAAWAAAKKKDTETPPATNENPSPISPMAQCLNEAQEKRDRCLDRSDVWGDLACAAVYLIDRADCILLPQS